MGQLTVKIALLLVCAGAVYSRVLRSKRQLGPEGFGPLVNWNRATNVGFPFGAVQNGRGGNVNLPYLNGFGWGRFGGLLRNRRRPGPAFGHYGRALGPGGLGFGGPGGHGGPGGPGGGGRSLFGLPSGSVNVGRGTNVAFPFGGVGVSRGVNVGFPFG